MFAIKMFIQLVLIVLGISISLIQIGCSDGSTHFYRDISPDDAYRLINDNTDNPDFMIIDVRRYYEFDSGHIENSLLINYYSSEFETDIDSLDRNRIYLLYCRHGARSSSALNLMKSLGFIRIYNMSGGIVKWIERGFYLVH